MTLSQFSFDLFIERVDVARAQETRPYLVGITGFDGSGKSILAQRISAGMDGRGIQNCIVHVDDFHFPRAHRYSGSADEPTKYLTQSFDFERLVQGILRPIHLDRKLATTLRCLDIATDEYIITRTYDFEANSVVIVEGVFLLRDDIRPHLDCILFLEATDSTLERRGSERDLRVLGAATDRKFREKYLPAQHRFHHDFLPERLADMIISNEDPQLPLVRKARPEWRL